jgi:formate hydrogenlyase subunit 3/multisubunit Na+/H+ antiporter MnhD subunit
MQNLIAIVLASISIAVSAIGVEVFNYLVSLKMSNVDTWLQAKGMNLNFLWFNLVVSVFSLLFSLYRVTQGDL